MSALLAFASWLVLLWAPAVHSQGRGKEIVVGLGAEHIYDRLLDRDAKTLKPKPMLPRADEKVWMYDAKVTPR